MAYEVTATRKRPRTFQELVGQEFVVATLTNAIRREQIAHAFLFSGPRGVGKTSAARVLARALNCDTGPTAEPCGKCISCNEILAGAALDVIEIDGASNTGVDDVRSIRDEVMFPPAAARYKVYIIDEVHMLSNSAFNALLKTIEEPPPYVVFVFATTEIHKVPATIRSRCQQFTFRLFSPDEIRERLAAAAAELELEADPEALIWIAKEADGSLRDAYTTFDQVVSFSEQRLSIDSIRETVGALGLDELNEIGRMIGADAGQQMLDLAAAALERGVSVERFVMALADYLRSLLLLKQGVDRPGILGYAAERFDATVVARLSVPQLECATEMLLELHRNLKQSVGPRFELELALSRLARIDGLVTADQVLAAVAAIKRELTGGGASTGALAPSPDQYVPGQEERPPTPATGTGAIGPTGAIGANAAPAAAAAPTESAASASPPVDSENAPTALDRSDPDRSDPERSDVPRPEALMQLVEAVRGERLLSLASSLERAVQLDLDERRLCLTFGAGDRYSGEHVSSERKVIARLATSVFSREVGLEVEYQQANNVVAAPTAAPTVERVRKVFRGEVVKEIKHGE